MMFAVNPIKDGPIIPILLTLSRVPTAQTPSIRIQTFKAWRCCMLRKLLLRATEPQNMRTESKVLRDLPNFIQERRSAQRARLASSHQPVSNKVASQIAGSLPEPLPSLRIQYACIRSCTKTHATTPQMVFSDTSSGLETHGSPSTLTTDFQLAIHTATRRITSHLMVLTDPTLVQCGCHCSRKPTPS